MTLEAYKAKIRTYRGALRSVENELNDIYMNGSYRFREMTLVNKTMGIRKMAQVCQLDMEEQDLFVKWLLAETRYKNEIDTKLLELV